MQKIFSKMQISQYSDLVLNAEVIFEYCGV